MPAVNLKPFAQHENKDVYAIAVDLIYDTIDDRLFKLKGEEGEVYSIDGQQEPPTVTNLTLSARFAFLLLLKNLCFKQKTTSQVKTLPFAKGDRVKDRWGNEATVTEIDLHAEHGYSHVLVKYDDGSCLTSLAIAHGFKKIDANR